MQLKPTTAINIAKIATFKLLFIYRDPPPPSAVLLSQAEFQLEWPFDNARDYQIISGPESM